MKGFLVFFLCFCFVGFPETSQANEQRYRKLCDRGDSWGCYMLGELEFERGNYEEVADLIIKSCDGEYTLGCNSLGNLEEERGNYEEAADFYRKSCDGGYFLGCNNLGNLEEERGNIEEAFAAYRKSCGLGNPYGCSKEEEVSQTDYFGKIREAFQRILQKIL